MAYALLAALAAEAARRGRGTRTLLVAPTRGEGREILRALARAHGGWLGLEVTTVRPLALAMVGADLGAKGLTLLDEFAEQALVDDLLDEALDASPAAAHLRELAEGVGFRAAVREAVKALRLAAVDARRLASAPFADRLKRDLLVALVARYEERLERDGSVDTAGVLRAATATARGREALPAESILLVPGLGTRGVAGRFLTSLEERGARRLFTDPVAGISVPEGILWQVGGGEPAPAAAPAEMFRAAGVTEELREVLRRVIARKLRWDEVEIVTPDAGAYGPALHSLAEQLDVPVTFAVGLPVERTRAGRAVAAYLRWVQDDFPDAVLRRLLEGGDLGAPAPFRDLDGPRLARALRRLRIGWGRERYLPAISSAIRRIEAEGPIAGREEDAAQAADRHARRLRELHALQALIEPILSATPAVPERGDTLVRVTPAGLAAGLTRFLDAVPGGGPVDATALERLAHILDRVAATLDRPTVFASAVTILAEHLAIRIPAPRAEGRAPWGSAGGHLHLSDLEHGGWSGRSEVFVVGLDAGRFPGQGKQDPVLLDRERGDLAAKDLPDSGARLEERRFRMSALLARLRGRVTMSYAAWEPSEGRTLAPSALLLDVFRAGTGGPSAGYERLEKHLGDPISRIPRTSTRLDREDVWLGALAQGGHLLAGEDVVRAGFSALDRGLTAVAARAGAPSAHRGLVTRRPQLDPRDRPEVALSASRLEALGGCGLRYFYQSVLKIRPPDDPAFDPERWLDALRRGSLLHAVYDRLLDDAKAAGIAFDDPAFADLGSSILREEAAKMRLEVPAPSESVWRREMADLEAEVRSFVGMMRDEQPKVEHTELEFGLPGSEHGPVDVLLPSGGRIRLRGSIDRVDTLPSGGLRVVDYKTGSNRPFSRTSVFKGGRRLQHALYGAVAESLLGREVEFAEYHFPTRKGENAKSPFHKLELVRGLELLDRLLDIAAAGRFLPTDDPDDCRICDFKAVCRARLDRWGKVDSPPAAWGHAHFEDEEYDLLRMVRKWS